MNKWAVIRTGNGPMQIFMSFKYRFSAMLFAELMNWGASARQGYAYGYVPLDLADAMWKADHG